MQKNYRLKNYFNSKVYHYFTVSHQPQEIEEKCESFFEKDPKGGWLEFFNLKEWEILGNLCPKKVPH